MEQGRASEPGKQNRQTPISTASLVYFRAALLPRPPCAQELAAARGLASSPAGAPHASSRGRIHAWCMAMQ